MMKAMAGLKLPQIPHAKLAAWVVLDVLLLLGIASTVVDYSILPQSETRLANEKGQRAVIDAATGNVALSNVTKDAFDVASPDAAGAVTTATADQAQNAPGTEASTAAPAAQAALPEGLPPLRTEPLPGALTGDVTTRERLVPAPAPEVSEKVEHMTLPKRSGGSGSPATIYARQFTRNPDQHLLTIVITDVGLSAQSLPLIQELPKEVTLAFSPYAPDARATLEKLRNYGYEAWGMMPVMTGRYPQDDPGPFGLVSNQPRAEMLRRLRSAMAETIGSVGMVMPASEALSSNTQAFNIMLTEVNARGLYLLSTRGDLNIGQLTRDRLLQPTVRRADMVLDPLPDDAQIQSKLAGLAETMKQSKELVVVTSARPQTLLLLTRWLKEHPLEAPAMLAPLSAMWQPEDGPAPAPEEKSSGGHGGGHGGGEEKKSDGGGHH